MPLNFANFHDIGSDETLKRGGRTYPLAYTVDKITLTEPEVGWLVPGHGDARVIPHAIVALMFGKTFDVDISVTGPGSLSADYADTLKTGVRKALSGEDETTLGEEILSITELWTFRYDEILEILTLKARATSLEISTSTETQNDSMIFNMRPTESVTSPILYYAALDLWTVTGMSFLFAIDDSEVEGDSGTLSLTFSTGAEVKEDLIVLGTPFKLYGTDGMDVSGTVTVTDWLPLT